MKLDFDDILIKPSAKTNINSRKVINITDYGGMLPLFTAPMDTVVNRENADLFINNGIRAVLPRNSNNSGEFSTSEHLWFSYGLREFEETFLSNTVDNRGATIYALIDIANGHMPALSEMIRRAKDKYGLNIVIMAGNIANPDTYAHLSECGTDLIRVGIGNGGGCLTTQQTGVGYPMASLIKSVYEVSCTLETPAKIIADGGFKKYSDVIKALALGADYVMLGSIFNRALESAGDNYKIDNGVMTQLNLSGDELLDFYRKNEVYKLFRGMSTKEVQRDWGRDEIKTSEGVVRKQLVEYTLNAWVENFSHYLRSAMSYTNCLDLNQFVGGPTCIVISQNAFNRYNK